MFIEDLNEGKKVCVSVRDTGMGIKKENLKKVFDKFYRVTYRQCT